MTARPTGHIQDYFEDQARSGDGAFAVAFALLELATAQRAAAKALDQIGFNDGRERNGPPGTTEKIAMELARLTDVLADRSR
ncbi:MAG: hypothetical protein WBA62_22165 [Xanthobacteraceae bacterium]